MPTARAVWTAFYMQLKQVVVDALALFFVIVQPLFIALLAIYVLRDSEGFQAIYVIVGSALTGLWSGTLFFNTNGIERERRMGTLEGIVGSPTHLATVVLGKALANSTLCLSSMIFSYPLAALLFGYHLEVAQPLLFAGSLLLTLFAMTALGMLIAPLISVRPATNNWTNLFEFPVYIAGGFLFPIALLPNWITPFSYLLSPYWAARALHAASGGGLSLEEILFAWFMLVAESAIYWFVSARLFRIVLRKVREDATLAWQ